MRVLKVVTLLADMYQVSLSVYRETGGIFQSKEPLVLSVCCVTDCFFLILLVLCLLPFITKLLFLNVARIQGYFAHGLNTKLYIPPLGTFQRRLEKENTLPLRFPIS